MKLVFVYNAKAGFAAGMMDTLHKTLSPGTYECALCAVTHGAFTMDKRWRAYLKGLPVEAVFHHRPDFREAYPSYAEWTLPLVALDRNGRLEPVLDAAALKAADSVDKLAAALDTRLNAIGVTAEAG
jgi:hypothetical protein